MVMVIPSLPPAILNFQIKFFQAKLRQCHRPFDMLEISVIWRRSLNVSW